MPDSVNEATAAARAVAPGCSAQTDHDREIPEIKVFYKLLIDLQQFVGD